MKNATITPQSSKAKTSYLPLSPNGKIFAPFEAAARDLYNVVHPRTHRIDTFLLSFQKCGRTWLELMLAHAFAGLYGLAPEQISRELPKMQMQTGRGPVIFSTHDWSETTGELNDSVSPHLMLAYPFRMRYWGRRVLMLIRDPRDTIVSSFYQVTQRAYRPLPFSRIDDYVLHPLYGFPRLIHFYKIWHLNRRFCREFKIVRYENLRREGIDALSNILDYVGLTGLSRDAIADIYAACTFDKVRAMEDAGFADLYKFTGPGASKARRGKMDGYQDELQPETIRQLDQWMRGLPPEFCYPS